MKRYRWTIAVMIVIGLGTMATFTSILEKPHPVRENSGDAVTVVSGVRPVVSRYKDYAQLKSERAEIEHSGAVTVAAPSMTDEPVRQLHDSILAEREDVKWAADVKRDVTSIVRQVPYISADHTLRCGTSRCELLVTLLPATSEHNAGYVASRFFSLPDNGQAYQIRVEGVFPSKERTGSPRTLSVIYMRDAG